MANSNRLESLTSEQLENAKKRFERSNTKELLELAKELGYERIDSLNRSMKKYGVTRKHVDYKIKDSDDPLTINLPPVKLITPKVKKTKGNEEVALLILGDGHAGKITKSFSKEIYKQRMETVFQHTMNIVNLHRNMYPIKKLVIANVGDNLQGENPFQGSKIGETECGARDQITKIATPVWNNILASFRQQFEEVNMYCVPGNHGAGDRLAPETSNHDLLLYDILKAGIGQEKGINIHSSDEWYMLFKIFGFKFFMFHGDSIPCQSGIPFFGIDKALCKWYMQFNSFNYALSGHFHKNYTNEVSSKLEHFMNGTLVTDDEWVLKKLKISSTPSQTLLGVHPVHGCTWRYPLVVDDKFMMEPLEKV